VLENWSRQTASLLTGWGMDQLDHNSEWVEKIQAEHSIHGEPDKKP
jgi:hypothetical protein